MAEQDARERGILAVSYPSGTLPSEPTETGVRVVSRGPDTRTWDVGTEAPAPTVPTAIAPPSTVAELLGKINPTLLAPPAPRPFQAPQPYPFPQPEPTQQPYQYGGYPEALGPQQSGWGQPNLNPFPDDQPAWGGQNNYQRNYDRPDHDRGGRGGKGGRGRGAFQRKIKPGSNFKTRVCKFWEQGK